VLKQHPEDAREVSIARLREKLGAVTMDNELLYKKIERLEGRPPFSLAEVEAMSRAALANLIMLVLRVLQLLKRYFLP